MASAIFGIQLFSFAGLIACCQHPESFCFSGKQPAVRFYCGCRRRALARSRCVVARVILILSSATFQRPGLIS